MKFTRSQILRADPAPKGSREDIIARPKSPLVGPVVDPSSTLPLYLPPGGAASALPTPLDIFGAALEGWWRGGDWTVTGSHVDQLEDLSGNSRHMVQTGSNRPTTTTLAGQDAVRFDPAGDDEWLELASGADFGSAPYALWAVFRFESDVSFGSVLTLDGGSSVIRGGNAGFLSEPEFKVGVSRVLSGVSALNTLRAVLAEDAAGTAKIYVDDAEEGSASDTHNPGSYAWALGARSGGTAPTDMTLLDAAVISGAITSGQRASLQAYAADRCGL